MYDFISKYDTAQVFVLTDENVVSHLPALGLENYPALVLPAGEGEKNLDSVCRIWDFLLAHEATRHALLMNVGGGVITDMGGFAAAAYKRGIDFVNIPSTLLAMVDAGSGGKTGVDYQGYKNVVGFFRQPVQTVIDMRLLQTLPPRELLSGYAEMVKHALIDTPQTLNDVLGFELSVHPDWQRLEQLLHTSIAIKDRIVLEDPNERALRKVLNFGHTVGHALESLRLEQSPDEPMPHGFAVMYGMLAELYLSHRLLGLDKQLLIRMQHFALENYGRVRSSCRQLERLIALMHQDKKNDSPLINCTLLRAVGEPVINVEIDDPTMQEALEYLFSI